MRRRTIALERNGAPLCTRSGCLRTLRGELTLKVGEKLRVLLSLTGRDGCVENAGNQAAAFRRVVHDLPSSMLEHLGHVRRHHRATGTRSNGCAGGRNVGEIGRSAHANDGPPRRRKGYDAPDRRLVRPETGWPGHETELSSLRYRAVHWIHIRGSPDGKSKERTLEEIWRATGKLPQRLRVVDGGHVACGSTGRFATTSSLPRWDAFGVLAGELLVRA